MAEDSPADDMLEGARAIATHIGKSLRKTNYLLESNLLPAFQLGRRWHMRKTTYATWIAQLEAKAMRGG